MKKLISVCLIILVFTLTSCAVLPVIQQNKTLPQTTEAAKPSPTVDLTNQVGSGKLGDVYVKIVGFEMDKTWQDEPCVLITYEWTNNSAETTHFMSEVDHQAFQKGIECEAKFMTDNLDESDFLTDVKPGYSLIVRCAYILRDSENPIEIEVTKYAGRDEKPFMVKQTFDIKGAA